MTTPNPEWPRVIDAIDYAAHAHRQQRRKDEQGTPYINHPVALVRILAVEAGVACADTLSAAALHDVLEDCCGGDHQPTLEEGCADLRHRFGAGVLALVEAVTDDKTLDKAERKRLQVEHAPHLPPGAQRIKLADKIANLRDILAAPPTDWRLERRQQYFDWAAQVVAGLRGVDARLAALFDAEYAQRPRA